MLKDFKIIKKNAFSVVSLLYKTNYFHVAVRLFSNRSQKTSKCGKNINDILGYHLLSHLLVLATFDAYVICDLLLKKRHGNRESIC